MKGLEGLTEKWDRFKKQLQVREAQTSMEEIAGMYRTAFLDYNDRALIILFRAILAAEDPKFQLFLKGLPAAA